MKHYTRTGESFAKRGAAMKKFLAAVSWGCALVLPTAAWAVPGEFWEITTKSEMAGMPMAMPATKLKVCIAKGSERTPQPGSGCELSELKTAGNKSSWKVTCVQRGETMTGVGESTYDADSSQSVMRMTGTAGKQKFDMTMNSQSKRLGGVCDTADAERERKAQSDKMQAMADKQREQTCDTSKFGAVDWVMRSGYFLEGNACPGKKDVVCEGIRREVARDAMAYTQFVNMEKSGGGKIARACGVTVEAATRSICQTLNGKNVDVLSAHCPAEAKAYRAAVRRKACEGHSYTAKSDLSKCLAKADGDAAPAAQGEESLPAATGKAKAKTTRAAEPSAPADDDAKWGEKKSRSTTPQSPADAAAESAKKLKGLFGL